MSAICSRWWAWRGGRTTGRPSSRAGSSSAWPSRRALASHPKLLLADEPTGQLDLETGRTVMILLRNVVRAEGVTAIVATHDPMMLDLADRVLELRDGAWVGDASPETVGPLGQPAAP